MVGSDQQQADPMQNHAVPDEALGHSGQPAHCLHTTRYTSLALPPFLLAMLLVKL